MNAISSRRVPNIPDPPKPKQEGLRVYDVEIGFPGSHVIRVYQVEATGEPEAFDILVSKFRRGLRVIRSIPKR